MYCKLTNHNNDRHAQINLDEKNENVNIRKNKTLRRIIHYFSLGFLPSAHK